MQREAPREIKNLFYVRKQVLHVIILLSCEIVSENTIEIVANLQS